MVLQPGTGIIFDSPYNTYFAGATVSGRIEIVLNKPKKIKGNYLNIEFKKYLNDLDLFLKGSYSKSGAALT